MTTPPSPKPKSAELKPCPFCGAVPRPHDSDFVISHDYKCYFTLNYAQEGWLVGQRAIKAWNTRANDVSIAKVALTRAI